MRTPIIAVTLAAAWAASCLAQPAIVPWSVWDNGFATGQSGSVRLLAAAGEPLVGRAQSPPVRLLAGFMSNANLRSVVVSVPRNETTPGDFVLSQNYPNPFNPSTTIRFIVPRAATLTLAVYDLLGRRVALLVGGRVEGGMHEVVFSTEQHASGTYFYRLRSEGVSITRKMSAIK